MAHNAPAGRCRQVSDPAAVIWAPARGRRGFCLGASRPQNGPETVPGLPGGAVSRLARPVSAAQGGALPAAVWPALDPMWALELQRVTGPQRPLRVG